MRISNTLPYTACFLVFGAAVLACGQAIGEMQVVREISDPFSGARWLLLRDGTKPGGPGQLVLESSSAARSFRFAEKGRPVIRAGERLVVEEKSARVDARLEAVALEAAAAGSNLKVRLRIGGRVLSAVALAPGRAAFPAPEGARR